MKLSDKLKITLINSTNVAEVYNRNFQRFLYLNSDEVIVNGELMSNKVERQMMMFSDKDGKPNIQTCEMCKTKDGFPITELDFITYELETLQDVKHKKFKEKKQLEMYRKYLTDRKREIETPLRHKNTTDLSIQEIALKLVYEEEYVTRDNSDVIIESFGKNSGENLYQWVSHYSSKANRIAEPYPSTLKKLTNKIGRLKKVISTLSPPHRSKAEEELAILQNIFEDKYR